MCSLILIDKWIKNGIPIVDVLCWYPLAIASEEGQIPCDDEEQLREAMGSSSSSSVALSGACPMFLKSCSSLSM